MRRDDQAAEVVRRQRSLRWAVRVGLGLAVVLFVGGIAIPIGFRVVGRVFGEVLLFTPWVDEAIFGRPPADIIAGEPAVKTVQLFYVDLGATMLLAMGVMVGFVTWFGLRAGHRWAWWAMFLSLVVATASVARIVLPYVLESPFGFADVPPIFWLPVLAPIPLILGWRGTKSM